MFSRPYKKFRHISKDKIKIIYNYVEIKNFYPTNNKKQLTVLALARVEDGKNPLLWIEIAEEILKIRNNIKFIWAGDGSLLTKCIEKAQNNDDITFIGFQEDVDKLYSIADIYFEPSKREAHGISVVGAMAHSIPAIATNNGGTTESVKDEQTGYIVDVTNKEMMLDRLLKLIDNPALRQEMGTKANLRYKTMFTKTTWEQEMIKI